jgi:hypothetical protein
MRFLAFLPANKNSINAKKNSHGALGAKGNTARLPQRQQRAPAASD